MKRIITVTIVIVLLIGCLFCFVVAERYRNAVYWVGENAFSKATSYVDEFPLLIEMYDPGFLSYAYAGEAMEYGHYEEAILLLKPLSEKNYRNSVQMLEYCTDRVK